MRLQTKTESFDLSAAGIDAFSVWMDETLPEAGLDHKNCLRVRLLAEELLLRMQEHLDAQTRVMAYLELRFHLASLRLEMEGRPCNPLGETAQELSDWNSSLLAAVGLRPRYSYSGGINTLRLPLPRKQINPVLKLLLLLFIGVAAGLLGLLLLPQSAREAFSTAALAPAFQVWMRILNAASAPIIFFMALTTMLNSGTITRQGGSGTRVIGRYLLITFLMIITTLIGVSPIFSTAHFGESSMQASWVQAITEMIPGNIVEPFMDSDTPQLLLLAFPLGAALIAAGDHAELLRRGVRETNVIGSLIANGLSRVIPFFAGLFLCLEIWNRRVQVLIGLWKPLALSFGVSALMVFLIVLLFAFRMKIGVPTLLKKLRTTFFTALRGAPLDETMDCTAETCIRQFGVDKKYAKACLPQGTVLYMPVSAIGMLVFSLYLLNVFEIRLSIVWQLILVLLVEFLFVATPPVPGANLLAFSVLFVWIGIPDEAILDAMIFDILFGFFASAANLTLLQMETALQARRLGFLNHAVLESKE